MKKLILIFLISLITSLFTNTKAQEPYFNIVQVKPPQHIQVAYENWINTSTFWLPHAEAVRWVSSGVFWKISANSSQGYNKEVNLSGSYIVPVDMPFFQPYISAIIISNDGSVDFWFLFGYTHWYQYVKSQD